MRDELTGVGFVEIEGENVASDLFENIVADALGQPIPNNHVFERLLLVVRSASRIHYANQVWAVLVEVINSLAHFLEFCVESLPIGVVGFVGENGQVRQ